MSRNVLRLLLYAAMAQHVAACEKSPAPCASDRDCESGFCDRGECADVAPRIQYGVECTPPPIGPYGGPVGKFDFCGGYLCSQSRCRSCSSDKECYDLVGLRSCTTTSKPDRPGFRCRAPSSSDGGYMPPELTLTGSPLQENPVATCSSDHFTAAIVGDAPVESSRVAVIWWHQRAGEHDEFLQVAYDRPLDPDAEVLTIPFSEVRPPFSENLICWRSCTDRSKCPCSVGNDLQIAVASVIVSIDRDNDGGLSLDEIRSEQLGVADGFIGYSLLSEDFPPPEWSGTLGVTGRGMCAYSDLGSPGRISVLNDEGAFTLNLCPSQAPECEIPISRLLCRQDCDRDWGLNRLGL